MSSSLVVAFDADDTLWSTEYFYRQAQNGYAAILAGYQVPLEKALGILHRIEIENLAPFGYGIRGYMISMIESAVEATNGEIKGRDIQKIIEIGRSMTSHDLNLMPGVEEALTQLSAKHPLLLITKGDVLDQQSKIDRSGIAHYFRWTEIVPDKTLAAYQAIWQRYNIQPENFVMIGNSLRSDIAPVLAGGGWAVYVPCEINWAHELQAEIAEDHRRYFQIKHMAELPALLKTIDSK